LPQCQRRNTLNNLLSKIQKTLIFGFSIVALIGCQSMPEKNSENISTIKYINIPDITKTNTVGPNELMYTNINQIGTIVLKPTELTVINANLPLMNHQVTVNQNSLFFKGVTSGGKVMICSIGATLKPTIGSSLPYCLMEGETKDLYNKVIIKQGFPHIPVYTENVPTFVESELSFNPNGPTKREIVFNKVDADNLFFTYKEYKENQLIKTQPIIHKLSALPFSVSIKDAEFLITSVHNKIDFTVTKVMKSTINDDTVVNCVNKNSGNSNMTKLKVCGVVYGVAFPN
jgi:hypothetical protein